MSKKLVYYDNSSKHNLTGGRWVYVDENGVPLSRLDLIRWRKALKYLPVAALSIITSINEE